MRAVYLSIILVFSCTVYGPTSAMDFIPSQECSVYCSWVSHPAFVPVVSTAIILNRYKQELIPFVKIGVQKGVTLFRLLSSNFIPRTRIV